MGDVYSQASGILPFFLNLRTLVAFAGGCSMVPVVRFLDYSHDEDGPWCGENDKGVVFGKWWLGTDGTYFGLFLESPWPFVMAWTTFGILIQQNLYAGNMEGKNKYSLPFVALFIALALNIGSHW